MLKEQVIIIGGGPAGVACAVQLKRYGIDPLLLEKNSIGGLVRNAWRLDNYPGFPDGISGEKMVEKLKAHLKRFEIRYQISEIRNLKYALGMFEMSSSHKKYTAQFVVLASGTKAKYVVPGNEATFFTEVFPLRGMKGMSIAIVGAGDAAFDYAMTLSTHNDVHIFNRGTRIKCVPALLEIAKKQEKISYHENSVPSDSFDYTIFATGREAELGFLSPELEEDRQQLEQQGLLYIIGDVKNGKVRQVSVATGDGIRAAMAIREKILEDESNQQDTGT